MFRRPILRNSANFLNAGTTSQKYSLVFTTGTSSYLSRSSSSYNRSKFAISFWLKRLQTGVGEVLCIKGTGTTATTEWYILLTSGNKFDIGTTVGGINDGRLITTPTYTSTSAFYHVLFHYDSANATAGDRMRLWVDGSEVTTFDTDTNPTLSAAVDTISTNFAVGAENDGGSPSSSIIHQWCLFSGVLPSVGSLRDSTTGLPINPVGQSGAFLSVTGQNAVVTKESVQGASFTNNGNVFVTTQTP